MQLLDESFGHAHLLAHDLCEQVDEDERELLVVVLKGGERRGLDLHLLPVIGHAVDGLLGAEWDGEVRGRQGREAIDQSVGLETDAVTGWGRCDDLLLDGIDTPLVSVLLCVKDAGRTRRSSSRHSCFDLVALVRSTRQRRHDCLPPSQNQLFIGLVDVSTDQRLESAKAAEHLAPILGPARVCVY